MYIVSLTTLSFEESSGLFFFKREDYLISHVAHLPEEAVHGVACWAVAVVFECQFAIQLPRPVDR